MEILICQQASTTIAQDHVDKKITNELHKYIFNLTGHFFITGCDTKKNKSDTVKEFSDDYTARIDSIINTTSPRIFNGVVLITKNGVTKYLKEHGYSDIENQISISVKDKFRIMSNSKQITAALILREVEKGKIKLQDPIREYLPNLNQTWADSVTVHQLLNMSSGIVDIKKPLIFEPGKGYRYSNPAYDLLGRIIRKVTGIEYIENAHNLFKELGMNESYCYELGKPNKGLINGYWLKDGTPELVAFDSLGFTEEEWKNFIPGGGIISTAHDLNMWDIKLHKGEILNADHHRQMVTPSNRGPHAAFDNDTIGYAYGLRVHDKHLTKHLGHGGRGFGFASIKFYIPENDVDVIIWENLYSRDSNWMAGDLVYHFENEIRKIILNSTLVK